MLPSIHEAIEVCFHPCIELGRHGVHGGFSAVRQVIRIRRFRLLLSLRGGDRRRHFSLSNGRCGRHLYNARNIRRRNLLGFVGLTALCAKPFANQFFHCRIVPIFEAMLGANS